MCTLQVSSFKLSEKGTKHINTIFKKLRSQRTMPSYPNVIVLVDYDYARIWIYLRISFLCVFDTLEFD